MKIGIVKNKFESFTNSELRILKEIHANTNYELATFLYVSATENSDQNQQSSFLHRAKTKLAKWFLQKQIRIEQNYFFKPVATVTEHTLGFTLKDIQQVDILDSAHANDLFFLNSLGIDLLLNFSAVKLHDEIVSSSKNGVWTLGYSNVQNCPKYCTTFWEVLHKAPMIGVSLVGEKFGQKESYLVDEAIFNRYWSLANTKNTVIEGSVSLLLKNVRLLQQNLVATTFLQKPTAVTYKEPALVPVLKYIFSFYGTLLKKSKERIQTKVHGTRFHCWTLFTGHGSFLTADVNALKPVNLPKGEQWADPFLFEYGKQTYVFFEAIPNSTKRGKISCGILKNNDITNVVDVFNFPYHMSYPSIFQEGDDIFLMPESCENKNLTIYRCLDFPRKWEVYATVFEGEVVCDATYYKDVDGTKWLFVNKQADGNAPMETELFIYRIDSLKFNRMEPHAQNPVIINAAMGRNGGAIFSDSTGVYRPSQVNIDGVYGRALSINKIEKLTINEYEERQIKIINPDFYPGLLATHHLHQTDDKFVIDAAYVKL